MLLLPILSNEMWLIFQTGPCRLLLRGRVSGFLASVNEDFGFRCAGNGHIKLVACQIKRRCPRPGRRVQSCDGSQLVVGIATDNRGASRLAARKDQARCRVKSNAVGSFANGYRSRDGSVRAVHQNQGFVCASHEKPAGGRIDGNARGLGSRRHRPRAGRQLFGWSNRNNGIDQSLTIGLVLLRGTANAITK